VNAGLLNFHIAMFIWVTALFLLARRPQRITHLASRSVLRIVVFLMATHGVVETVKPDFGGGAFASSISAVLRGVVLVLLLGLSWHEYREGRER
jgi:hypothetical protein